MLEQKIKSSRHHKCYLEGHSKGKNYLKSKWWDFFPSRGSSKKWNHRRYYSTPSFIANALKTQRHPQTHIRSHGGVIWAGIMGNKGLLQMLIKGIRQEPSPMPIQWCQWQKTSNKQNVEYPFLLISGWFHTPSNKSSIFCQRNPYKSKSNDPPPGDRERQLLSTPILPFSFNETFFF